MTKPFLLLFLALYYVFSVDKISLVLLFALLTSWLGDVLLIPKGHKWFSAGGVSFMVSHFLFIAVYIERISFAEVLWLPVIVAAAGDKPYLFAGMFFAPISHKFRRVADSFCDIELAVGSFDTRRLPADLFLVIGFACMWIDYKYAFHPFFLRFYIVSIIMP